MKRCVGGHFLLSVSEMVNCHWHILLQKAGLAPTGILANAAKALGFASVDALLKVNPEAAQINLPAHTPAVQTTEEPPADATILQVSYNLQQSCAHTPVLSYCNLEAHSWQLSETVFDHSRSIVLLSNLLPRLLKQTPADGLKPSGRLLELHLVVSKPACEEV